MRHMIAALVRLLIIFGGASFVNPLINQDADLSAIWVDIPPTHVALEGDLHVQIYGANGRNLRVRIARDDDEDRTQLATMPLTLDLENRMTIPCGYFSRGGIYYLEVIADVIRDSFKDYEVNNESYEISNDFSGKVLIGENNIDSVSVKLNKRQISEGVNVNNNVSDPKSVVDNISNKNQLIYNTSQSIDKVNSNSHSNKYKDVVNESLSKLHNVRKRQTESQKATVMETGDTIVKSWKFEVLWPSASLDVTPEKIQTYPETQVTAIIEFSKVVCTPIESTADFWLELLYCGHSSGGAVLCDGKNTSSHAHVLYSEQMHGFPGRRTVTLRCELFGQAGDYYLTLRPAAPSGPQDLASAFIKADWSEQFVLNVHGGSVFPCGEGVRTLFQYPECALEGADRVRVFGRESDKLRYVAERRVRRGQHTATFECRLFSERYPEYCFVYVSQAVTGAVADVRMDCLPTSPLSDGGAGGWGEWSPWSACPAPAHCSTRTRSRHRFCDNPPPAYGAKYCEGNAVELAACDCTAPPWPGDSSGIVAEVGPRCRCGCVLHLAPTARLLAGSARACPARSFWLLQAEEGLSVRLRIEAVRLPCMGQSLKIRDGDSLGSQLLVSWDNGNLPVLTGDANIKTDSTGLVDISAGRHVLVELRSSDVSERCSGGFLAHATQYAPSTESVRNASAVWASIDPAWFTHGNSARLAVLALVITAVLAALALTIHSAHRTRAYHRAADKESLTDSDACSASLELAGATSGSRSTLLSDVVGSGVALRRLLPSGRAKHTRLRESVGISANLEPREDPEDQSDGEEDQSEKMSIASHTSAISQATVTPESGSASSVPAQNSVTPVPLRRAQCHRSSGAIVETVTSPPQPSITSETTTTEMSTSISSVSEREGDSCSDRDKDSVWERDARSDSRASSSTSAATLTNGWYSPALSGVTSARVRGNSKRSKESSNRKLLKSDLSLTSHPEMEMDYYDYEVNNAGSVPGSYLGMDPAFLVWIPPLDEGDIINDIDDHTPVYEEILPRELLPDPGSNTESPDDLPSSSTLRRSSDKIDPLQTIKSVIDRSSIIQPLNFSASDLQQSPQLPKRNKKHPKNQETDVIQMRKLSSAKLTTEISANSYCDSSTLKRINDNVKEKRDRDSMKSDDMSDLRFADDSESSNDIKFADDDTPDSNKLNDKFVQA